jgi:long-chain-acyl-CoA dehydrogenase
MERDIYDEDHEAFRDLVKDFVKRHVSTESIEKWEAAGEIDRETMLAAGEAGLIGLSVPEEFGGAGMLQDYRFRTIVMEEVIAAGAGSLAGAFGIQDDLAVPYLVHMGTQEQKEKWLPRMATGEVLGALAMTDPGAGSDLRGIKTNAKKVDGGYIVNGAKTFISSGTTADIVVTFVKTGEGNRPDAFSLLILEKGMEGFDQGKKLKKMGFHGWDTAELSFTDVFVPDENLISGKEGQGFIQPAARAPLDRRRRCCRSAGRDRLDHHVHQGPRGVRRADRRLPEHALPARRYGHHDRGHVGVHRPRADRVQGPEAHR